MTRGATTVPKRNVGGSIKVERLTWLDHALQWLGHQRWLRYGLRDRLIRLFRPPERASALDFEVPFVGFVYPGRMNRWIDWIAFYYGAYELDELELMRHLLMARPSSIALDIGANVGHHSLYMASYCSEVHAFEPFDVVAASLDEKVRRNGLKHVHVHRMGLSDSDQELEFFAPQGINTGTGTFVATHEPENNRPIGRLKLRHADSYLDLLKLQAIDLIKIDVEGFELTVLRGLRATLIRYRPVVMMELSDQARLGVKTLGEFMNLFPPEYEVQLVHSRRARYGVFGHRECALEPLVWNHEPTPGGYVNLLVRPRVR